MALKTTARGAISLIAACALALSLSGGSALAQASDGFWIGGVSGGGSSSGGSGTSAGPAREVEVGKAGSYRYNTIADGIRAAGSGGIVRVHPGIYVESLKITRPVTILGLVNRPDENLVKIQAPADQPCVSVETPGSGFVSLRQIDLMAGAQNVQRSCVEVDSGYLSIKDSSIVAPNYVSVVLARGGHLSIETSTITGGREGVLITARDGVGTYYIVGNKIIANITGIKVDGLAQANIVGNEITQNANDAVVYFQGRGNVIGNDIHHNTGAGIVLQDSPQMPNVKYNKILENAGSGLRIVPATAQVTTVAGRPIPVSKGLICENSIVGNFGPGIDSLSSGVTINCANEVRGNKGDRPQRRRGFFGGN